MRHSGMQPAAFRRLCTVYPVLGPNRRPCLNLKLPSPSYRQTRATACTACSTRRFHRAVRTCAEESFGSRKLSPRLGQRLLMLSISWMSITLSMLWEERLEPRRVRYLSSTLLEGSAMTWEFRRICVTPSRGHAVLFPGQNV